MEALRRELGLDQPLPVQYLRWAGRLLQGDFGKSIRNGAPVRDEIPSRIPATLQLGMSSFALSLVVALPLGILAAVFRRSPLGFLATAFTQAGVALPSFFVGLVLIFVVALSWRLLPPGRLRRAHRGPRRFLRRLILPAFTLSLAAGDPDALHPLRAAGDALPGLHPHRAAKGLRERVDRAGHALKNALIPSVTLLGLQVGAHPGGGLHHRVRSSPGRGSAASASRPSGRATIPSSRASC